MADTPPVESTHICPKCNSSMEKGLIHDSRWKKLKELTSTFITMQKTVLNFMTEPTVVYTYKCTKCGFIEQYGELFKQ